MEERSPHDLQTDFQSEYGITYKNYLVLKSVACKLRKNSNQPVPTVLSGLFAITNKFSMSEIEIVLWSIYLERYPLAPYSSILLEYYAYASKVFANKNLPGLETVLSPSFRSEFNNWVSEIKFDFVVTFEELNKRFSSYNRMNEVSQVEANHLDYNELVTSLLESN